MKYFSEEECNWEKMLRYKLKIADMQIILSYKISMYLHISEDSFGGDCTFSNQFAFDLHIFFEF